MSIYGLMTRAARGDAGKSDADGSASAAPLKGPATASADTGNAVAALADRIPAEAIALYTAILAFLVPQDEPLADQSYTGRAALAIIVAVVAVLYAVGAYYKQVNAAGGKFRFPVWKTISVLLAYLGWVFIIPGSPFGAFDWYTPDLGAIVGLLINALIGGVALFVEKD